MDTTGKHSPSATSRNPNDRRERIWKKAYAAKSREDLEQLYREWADSYDDDHAAIGFFGHELASQILARYTPFPAIAAVLDAGAGTGAAGEALHRLGYRNLYGIDLSTEMLAKAERKGIYRQLSQADLALPLDSFPCNHFDAAILVGVFSFGQAPALALDEIVRVVRPGGVVTFTMRVDFFEQDAMGVRTKLEELERSHSWKQLEITDPEQYLPKKDPDALFRVWCYRVLETKTPPVDEALAAAVREAFTRPGRVRRIDHSYIWNSTGSRLYERYTRCPEYYLTDTELEILAAHAEEILDDNHLLVELGCGSARKVSLLIDAAIKRRKEGRDRRDGTGSKHGGKSDESAVLTYTPVDVSQGALEATRHDVDTRYGDRVDVAPRCGRFDEVLASIPATDRKLIVFFGGSIGNFESVEETIAFLEVMRERMTTADRFVVGIDLHKDEAVMRAAYEAGPRNRSFFLNMVRRMNQELGANFDLAAFRQESPYEPDPPHNGIDLGTRCVHFRLVSERSQDVYISSMHMEAHMDAGDAIQVGTSRKFEPDRIARLGELAGLRLRRQWFDSRRYFSLNEFFRDDAPGAPGTSGDPGASGTPDHPAVSGS
jgi:uncharacterized SAM-dependent methyltransferase/ubiquinone/menaquinone biosynthesis C-methylase UbiE